MAEIQRGRWTADIEGDFVVFLIGARVNNKLRAIKALRAISGMKPMLDYLTKRPEKGLLGYEFGFPTIVQYWRSFEQLEAFATDKDDPHLEVWRRYQRTVLKSGEAGIWHETFLVRAGEYEAVYSNLPLRGLAKASKLVPISAAKERAAARLGRTAAV